MVVTRKVRTPKKDDPTTSAAEEAAEEILPEIEEPDSEAAADVVEAVTEVINIKAEALQSEAETEPERGDGTEGKRIIKPSFKVKYANQKLAG